MMARRGLAVLVLGAVLALPERAPPAAAEGAAEAGRPPRIAQQSNPAQCRDWAARIEDAQTRYNRDCASPTPEQVSACQERRQQIEAEIRSYNSQCR